MNKLTRFIKSINKTQKKVIVIAILILVVLVGFYVSSLDEPVDGRYILFKCVSIEGFRLEMTPRTSKVAAEENGWTLDTSSTLSTFEDIIERRASSQQSKKNNSVELKRGNESITLYFKRGVLNMISYSNRHFKKQQAEDLWKSYSAWLPGLEVQTKNNSRTAKGEYGKGWVFISMSCYKQGEPTEFASFSIVSFGG